MHREIHNPGGAHEERMEDRYKFYYAIGRLFNSSLNINLLLDIVLSRIVEEMNVEAGSFWLYDNEREMAICSSCQSPGGNAVKSSSISVNIGVKGYCMRNRKSIIIEDTSQVPWFNNEFEKKMKLKTRNMLCIPLMHKQGLMGILELINSRRTPIPFTQDDIDLLEPLANTAAMALHSAHLFTGIAEKDRMKKELEFASFLQSAILPIKKIATPFFEMRAKLVPSKELGGDFYDWRELDEDKFLFLIADVSGNGNPAAIFMAIVRSVLWTVSNFFHDPQKICEKTNEFVRKSTRIDMFVTLLLLIADMKKKTLKYVSAGHNSGLLIRKDGERIPLKTKGLPLGVIEKSTYEQKEVTIQDDDLLILYTDGITETLNADEEEFGEKRLEKLIMKYRNLEIKEILNLILNKLDNFSEGSEIQDDRCMLMVRLKEGADVSKLARSKLRSFSMNVSNEMSEVIKILEYIEKLAQSAGFSREEINDILISTEETCVNVIRYGLPRKEVTHFEIESFVEGDKLTITVKDRGVPFDPTRFIDSASNYPSKRREAGGYGLLLIRQLMDEINYQYDEEKGNTTTLIKIKKKIRLEPEMQKLIKVDALKGAK
ncbi:MAG: SpoIIE family protein phosphatase [Candidatus Eremiobacteraeota bacterium]|nr:SpoIIE family protein phosphatase [Candidatus Eremiobacteraeota bacterium]